MGNSDQLTLQSAMALDLKNRLCNQSSDDIFGLLFLNICNMKGLISSPIKHWAGLYPLCQSLKSWVIPMRMLLLNLLHRMHLICQFLKNEGKDKGRGNEEVRKTLQVSRYALSLYLYCLIYSDHTFEQLYCPVKGQLATDSSILKENLVLKDKWYTLVE